MEFRRVLSPCAVLLVTLIGTGRGSAQEPQSPSEATLELTLEQLGPPPYPCQAVRLRTTVRNKTDKRVHRLSGLDIPQRPFRIKGPYDARPVERLSTVIDRIPPQLTDSPRRVMADLDAKFHLDPGEQLSISYAIAAEWSEISMKGNPLFTEPGNYEIHISKSVGPALASHLTAKATIRIAAPNGDEQRALVALHRDPELFDALLRPVHRPPVEVVPRLRIFLERYPKTTYAAYAHFALARHHYYHFKDHWRLRIAWAAIHLDSILDNPDFAYQPYAQILMLYAAPYEAGQWEIYLRRHHHDAAEWLEQQPLAVGETWTEYRKRTPEQAKKEAPRPMPRRDVRRGLR